MEKILLRIAIFSVVFFWAGILLVGKFSWLDSSDPGSDWFGGVMAFALYSIVLMPLSIGIIGFITSKGMRLKAALLSFCVSLGALAFSLFIVNIIGELF